MRKRIPYHTYLYIAADIIAILFSLYIATIYSTSPLVIKKTNINSSNMNHAYIVLLTFIAWYISLKIVQPKAEYEKLFLFIDLINIVKSVAVQVVVIIIGLFLVKERVLARHFIVAYAVILVSVTLLNRIILIYLFGVFDKSSKMNRYIILDEDGKSEMIESEMRKACPEYQFVGYLNGNSDKDTTANVIGNIYKLESMLRSHSVNTVFFVLSESSTKYFDFVVDICQKKYIDLKIVSNVFTPYSSNLSYSLVGEIPVATLHIDKLSESSWRTVKRFFDLLLTVFFFCTIFWWLVPVITVIQFILNHGAVLYKSVRIGRNGKVFTIYKFRTMNQALLDGPNGAEDYITIKNDPRITSFGRFLRKHSLDELPQFINVLKGEMSIVGPRPLEVAESQLLRKLIPNYHVRDYICPGITGWAQINGYRSGNKDADLMKNRINLDRWYAMNWSVELDLRICLRSCFKVITGDPKAY